MNYGDTLFYKMHWGSLPQCKGTINDVQCKHLVLIGDYCIGCQLKECNNE